MPVMLRGLMWAASLMGFGSWLGGDTVENQTIIKQTSWEEKVFWGILVFGGLFGLIAVIWLFINYIKRRKKSR